MSDKRLEAYINKINGSFADFIKFYGFAPADFDVNQITLAEVCDRYFRDVARLHTSHGIKRIDAHKIAGYMTYWLSKLKPVNVVNPQLYSRHSEMCLYINEIFALCFSTGRLLQKHDVDNVRTSGGLLSSFLYMLKYRVTTGDNLAIMFYLLENGQAST